MKHFTSYCFLIILLLSFTELYSKKVWVLSKPPAANYAEYDLIKCLDSNNCYLIEDLILELYLYKSTDQGRSWIKVFKKHYDDKDGILNIYKCKMVDSNHIYLNNIDKVAIIKSNDGGKSFENVLFGDISEIKHEYIYDISMFSNKIGVALTRDYLICTYDNWETNTIVTLPDSIHSEIPIFHLDSNNIVFNRYDGYNEDFIRYDIVNQEWSIWGRGKKKVGEYKKINYLDFVNDTVAYGCGTQRTDIGDLSKDIIWKTTDKGKTWTILMDQLNDPGFGLSDIAFRNELHGIVIGNYGKILETTDGGVSWFQYPIRQEMTSWTEGIDWAGSVPLFATQGKGVFRLETETEVKELSSNSKFRVYQSGTNLEIAINDGSHSAYSFQLYNNSAQKLLTHTVPSTYGFVFESVELMNLDNGVYYYTISSSGGVEFTGKLAVVN